MQSTEKKSSAWQVFANMDLYLAVVIMFLLIGITFAGVIFRYVVSKPFTWLEEVQRMCLIWIVFLTGGAAFRKGSHIAVELLVDAMPEKLRRATEWLIRIVVVAILVYLTIQSIGYVQLFYGNGRLSPVLRIPQWLIYLVAPIGCADMLSSFLVHEIRILRNPEQRVYEEKEEQS